MNAFPSLLQSAEDERRPLLSKWWRSESAQNAIARAKAQRQERFEKVRAQFQAKHETLVRDVELWSEVNQ